MSPKKKTLSNRERDVARLLELGMSHKLIGEQLFICEKTIKFHCGKIYKKCDVKNKFEFVLKYSGGKNYADEVWPDRQGNGNSEPSLLGLEKQGSGSANVSRGENSKISSDEYLPKGENQGPLGVDVEISGGAT